MRRAAASRDLPALALSHGQARWLLSRLRCGWRPSEPQLDAWLKFLRRAGLPFTPEELGVGTGHNLVYGFAHVMELALALALKGSGLLDGELVRLIQASRDELRGQFAQAWLQRAGYRGKPITVTTPGEPHPLAVAGLFLQLWSEVEGVEAGAVLWQPLLLDPWQALVRYATPAPLVHLRPPLALSALAQDVVRLAAEAPPIRRGRPKGA
jgi:hypothetical protein